MKKVALIGGGNLGTAIAQGLKNSDEKGQYDIWVSGRKAEKLKRLKDAGINTSTSNLDVIKNAAVIILCVQPGQLTAVLAEIKNEIAADTLVVSTITGVKTGAIKAQIDNGTVVRAMPNTATAIGQSMTCLCSKEASEAQLAEVEEIFKAVGSTICIEEELMEAATVLGASGIAFFLRFLRAAIQGGIQMGFHPHEAQLIAVQTAIGAASLVRESNNHPEMEIDKVTTPRGCTIQGLNEMEHQGLSSAIIKGLMASFDKIKSM